MFELNFADLLDPNHELMRAAKLIDWDELHEALRFYYSTRGRHGKPIRLMVGLQLLKHNYNCADLLYHIRERIVKQVKHVRQTIGLKKPHRDSNAPWFKKALKQRVKIEPVIGHLKADHRMDRCRYKGPQGDTTNVVWTAAAWNMRKVTRLYAVKQAKAAQHKTKCAA